MLKKKRRRGRTKLTTIPDQHKTTIYMPPAMYRGILEAAKVQRRTVTSQVIFTIEQGWKPEKTIGRVNFERPKRPRHVMVAFPKKLYMTILVDANSYGRSFSTHVLIILEKLLK